MEATTKVLEDGRVTIPKPLREHMDLERGDLVKIEVEPLEGDNEE